MPDIVRVRVNGIEHNVGRAYAAAHDLEVIDAPTHARSGRPLAPTRRGRPLKPKTSVDAAKKAATKKRTPAKKAAPKTSAAPAAEKAAVESADTKKEI